MSRLAQRDEASLEELYERHAPRLYSLCLRVLHQPGEAQSVLSDVFHEVWQRAERFNPERGSVRTYLVTLTRCRAIDRLRSETARTANEKRFSAEAPFHQVPESRNPDPSKNLVQDEILDLVRQALEGMPARQRESLELAYFDGLTHQEISERLKLPLGSVKTHIRLGLQKLRRLVLPACNERPRS